MASKIDVTGGPAEVVKCKGCGIEYNPEQAKTCPECKGPICPKCDKCKCG